MNYRQSSSGRWFSPISGLLLLPLLMMVPGQAQENDPSNPARQLPSDPHRSDGRLRLTRSIPSARPSQPSHRITESQEIAADSSTSESTSQATSELPQPPVEPSRPGSQQSPAEPSATTPGTSTDIPPDSSQEQSQQPSFNSLFNIPERLPDYKPSKAIRCDVVRHLKTPSTYRRLDSYMRPDVILPAGKESDILNRDFLTGDWGGLREKLYKDGIDFYGCLGFDYLRVIKSNLSQDPNVATPPPNYRDQQNYIQLYGLDFYSHLINKSWKGGQLHFSFAWPESRPIWLYGNSLTPIQTQSVHGNFYYDTGTTRDLSEYLGPRVFEIWLQQTYGSGVQAGSFLRVGNIYPWINFNRSILAGMFNFWTFDEPGSLGTNPNTGRGPIYPTAPLGIQWYQIINTAWDFRMQVGAGYYDPSSGLDNRNGLRWFLDKKYGIEGVAEITYRGGTYSMDPNSFGKPWYIKLGGQFHTGDLYSNYLDINGDPFQITGLDRKVYDFNAGFYVTVEAMLYRVPGSYNKGLTAFAKTSQYFLDYANLLRNTYVFGLGYEGLLPGRDRDVLFVGYGLKNMTDGARLWNILSASCALKAAGDCRNDGRQQVLEVGYSAQITPWMFIQPGFQLIIDPYGRKDLGDIGTFTFSVGIAF